MSHQLTFADREFIELAYPKAGNGRRPYLLD